MKDDRVYLDHILDCLRWTSIYTAEGREAFFSDRKTQSAVLRELQIMAESAQRLSADLKRRHPEVSWQGLAGFRNVLVHDYLGIKPERIWTIIENDLPVLRSAVEDLRKTLS
ncbi:MAG: DUF86 domain-containing protein [Chloroflexi bacterium]|nr:DUF86 domain-containing protein [Chloroflexota bacterium]